MPVEQANFDLQQVMNLDMGRTFFGLMNNSTGHEYDAMISSWQLTCKKHVTDSKTWVGIIPFYEILWPNNIILKPSMIEKFEDIFSLIFPLKIAKHKISLIYQDLQYLSKYMGSNKVLFLIQKLKMMLDHIVNAFLGYIYIDVIRTELQTFRENFDQISDFDALRKKINFFWERVYDLLFFNYPEVIRNTMSFFDIVNTFEHLIETFDQTEEKEISGKISTMISNTENTVIAMLRFLDKLTVSGINLDFAKFMLRMNYNDYFKYDEFTEIKN